MDGRPNRRNKAAFSNFCGAVLYSLNLFVEATLVKFYFVFFDVKDIFFNAKTTSAFAFVNGA